MLSETRLLAAVDAAFADSARDLAPWPDPHQGDPPADDDYSRVTDPERFRLLGARADAWIEVLTEQQLARTDHEVRWSQPPGTVVERSARLLPTRPGALPLVIARSEIAGVPDAGVTLGVGHPAVFLEACPVCGCDACDRGSEEELDRLDRFVLAVVLGRFRRVLRGDRQVTVLGDDGWSAQGMDHAQVVAVLGDPTGWDEISGPSWQVPTDQ